MEVTLMCTENQRQYLHEMLFNDDADIVMYGGARGPGKTHIDVLAQVLRRLYHPVTPGIIIRKTQRAADQTLKTVFDRIHFGAPPVGMGLPPGVVQWLEGDKYFRYANGSKQYVVYCNKDSDYEQFMSGEYPDQAWEELTQHKQKAFQMVGGSCRAPASPRKIKAKKSGNANPGGQGHQWVKESIKESHDPNIIFIPARPMDNMALLENDPGYIDRELTPLPEWQRRQWRDGDWDAGSGQYFNFNREQVREMVIPRYASWYGGVDWGRSAPFCCLFIAAWEEPYSGEHHVHVRSEIYKRNLEIDEQAQAVIRRENDLIDSGELNAERVTYYADPAVGKPMEGEREQQGRTIRNTWQKYGFKVLPARTNVRVTGWELLKMLMKHGILTINPSCKALLTEILGAIYEGTDNGGEPTGEDISVNVPDHALDALRYFCVSKFGVRFRSDQVNPYTGRFVHEGSSPADGVDRNPTTVL